MKQETVVLIIGAGPAGLASSACLNVNNIPNIVLEKEDCCASLWKKRTYDRLKLHIAKNFCQLPHMPYPPNSPTFIPKNGFVQYLDDYVSQFNISPLYYRAVEAASFDKLDGKWHVEAKNLASNEVEEFVAEFLVVASGENSESFIPQIPGLDSFGGEVMHSNQFKNGKRFCDKNVLVVGSGNSGMEIASDLFNWGARTSIVVRSPVHVLTKELVYLGMTLLRVLPCCVVDSIVVVLGKLLYGDLSSFGLRRPVEGPFYGKLITGRTPVIDVGTVDKIKKGHIQVVPGLLKVKGDKIEFENGKMEQFDAIVFATGYRSTVRKWLKDDSGLFKGDGMPKQMPPNHWKGNNGLYCAGFARSGLAGISNDAKNIADDISKIVKAKGKFK